MNEVEMCNKDYNLPEGTLDAEVCTKTRTQTPPRKGGVGKGTTGHTGQRYGPSVFLFVVEFWSDGIYP